MYDTDPQTAAGKVLWHLTMSLDGFVAGSNHQLDWMTGFSQRPRLIDEYLETTGAVLAGRDEFDSAIGDSRPYGGAWAGRIFVLTHYPEDARSSEGGPILNGPVDEAVRIALAAAAGKNVEVLTRYRTTTPLAGPDRRDRPARRTIAARRGHTTVRQPCRCTDPPAQARPGRSHPAVNLRYRPNNERGNPADRGLARTGRCLRAPRCVDDRNGVHMEQQIEDCSIHYVEHGSGIPLVALHGAGVDHREIEAAIEAIVAAAPGAGYRRIYPDLPGMGRSTAGGLTGNDDVVTLLGDFIDRVCEGPVMLLGHSYGAYLARGVAVRRQDLMLGLALLCPVAERTGHLPDHDVVRQNPDAYDELEPAQRAGFDEYFVVRTSATARRYRDFVLPGTALVDEAALGRIMAGRPVDVGSCGFSAPTLIAAGRRDSVVGYTDATDLLDRYPHATLAVIADAGHALMHERAELLAALLADWIDRARFGSRSR